MSPQHNNRSDRFDLYLPRQLREAIDRNRGSLSVAAFLKLAAEERLRRLEQERRTS